MEFRIRRANVSDLPVLARFGLALARTHVAVDDRRFVVPEEGLDAFLQFFRDELDSEDAALFIADDEATPAGYAFLRMEPASIEALCDAAAWLHDLYVDPPFRGRGAGRQLMTAAMESARQLGSTSLMLGVSPANSEALRLYEHLGLRATMIEMRVELK